MTFTAISRRVAETVQAKFPDVNLIAPTEDSQQVRVVDGRVLDMIEKTCSVRVALLTSWGPVTLVTCSFVVMPGTDDVIILGNRTLRGTGY